MKYKKLAFLLIGILSGILIGVGLIGVGVCDAKRVKQYIGKYYISTYKPSDSSQNGHGTASGRRAKSGRTVAVDRRSPKAKMGTWVFIAGCGKRRVEDTGGFGRFNGGRRAFDVFMEDHERGGLFFRKCYIYRPETKKEKEKRLARERKKRQRGWFYLVYDEDLKPWQVITDPKYIKGGCISFGGGWFDVVKTEKGLGNKIKVGTQFVEDFDLKLKLDMVEEGAVG